MLLTGKTSEKEDTLAASDLIGAIENQNSVHIEMGEDISSEPQEIHGHPYDCVVDLKRLFLMPVERAELFERLSKPQLSYKNNDSQKDKDETKVAQLVIKDIFEAYKAQPHNNKKTLSKIKFERQHLINAGKALKKLFPDVGPASLWYEVQGRKVVGLLESERGILKAKLRKTQPKLLPVKIFSTATRPKKSQKVKTSSISNATESNQDFEILCHSIEATFDVIHDEYLDFLVTKGFRTNKKKVDKFLYLQEFGGKLVSL